MKLNRRQFSALALGSLAAACTPRQTAASGLVFWTMQLQPTFTDFINDCLAAFTAETGIAVQWVDVPWADMESKILTAIVARNAPDVVNLNPPFAAKLAERNALLDVWPLLSDRDREAYYPRLWQANQWQDTTFGIPWYVTTDVTFYNQSLLDAAGLNQPPRTFSELATAAAQIKAETGKYAFLLTMDGSQVLEAMVQMGLELLKPDGSAAFATPAGEAIFQYWVDLFQNDLIPREILTESHRRASELYQAGELAFLLTGPQFWQQIEDNAPSIAAVTSIAPQITNDLVSASVMNVAIPQQSQQSEAALQLALFLTNASNQLAFAQLANILPSTIASAADPYFQADSTPRDRARQISAAQLTDAAALISPGLDRLQELIYSHLQRAMLAELSAAEAVAGAAAAWSERGVG